MTTSLMGRDYNRRCGSTEYTNPCCLSGAALDAVSLRRATVGKRGASAFNIHSEG